MLYFLMLVLKHMRPNRSLNIAMAPMTTCTALHRWCRSTSNPLPTMQRVLRKAALWLFFCGGGGNVMHHSNNNNNNNNNNQQEEEEEAQPRPKRKTTIRSHSSIEDEVFVNIIYPSFFCLDLFFKFCSLAEAVKKRQKEKRRFRMPQWGVRMPTEQWNLHSPETNELHLKMDGWNWNTIVSFWDCLIFRGKLLVSGSD